MDHADHIIQITPEPDIEDDGDKDAEGESPVHKKRKLMLNIVNEYDVDIGDLAEDVVNMETGSNADSVEDPSFEPQSENAEEAEDDEEFVVDDDELASSPSEKEDKEEEPRLETTNQNVTLKDDDNCFVRDADSPKPPADPESSDVQYYYFCLDCEEESSSGYMAQNDSIPNNPKFPVSIDIARHMTAKNHQNFVPIKKKLSINVQNLSFNPNYHKTVIKRWKNLVKAGDITEVSYANPRVCRKCNIVMDDAVDMFKHIRDVHIKTLETTSLEQRDAETVTHASEARTNDDELVLEESLNTYESKKTSAPKIQVKSVEEAEQIAKNLKEKLNSGLYRCTHCGYETKTRTKSIKTHILSHFDGLEFKCNLCDKSYPTKQGLCVHKSSCHRS